MIGRVYTQPTRRNKGYATLATSAITEEALGSAEAAALFVRSDNCPAVSVYEKIGYGKIGEKVWVDVGTGLRP
jgi:predicted GNAT family acetyltransferase